MRNSDHHPGEMLQLDLNSSITTHNNNMMSLAMKGESKIIILVL